MSVAVDAGVLATWRATSRVERALLLGTFVNKLGGFLQVFLVLFLIARGFSQVQAGVALGTYGAGSVVGVLIGGWVSDRLGVRVAISGSMAATAVLLVSILHMHRYEELLVVVSLVGAIGQFYRPASATLLAELTAPQRQVMVFAMSRLALNLGTTAAPLLGAALVAVSYDLLFWCEALAAVAFAVLALAALGSRSGQSRTATSQGPTRAAPDGATPPDGIQLSPDAAREVPENRSGGYLALLRDRRFVAYLVVVLVNAVVYSQYLSTLPLTIRDRGLGPFWSTLWSFLTGVFHVHFQGRGSSVPRLGMIICSRVLDVVHAWVLAGRAASGQPVRHRGCQVQPERSQHDHHATSFPPGAFALPENRTAHPVPSEGSTGSHGDSSAELGVPGTPAAGGAPSRLCLRRCVIGNSGASRTLS